jgi:hypothetical protein
MAMELDAWLKSSTEAPGVEEAPKGWHKFFGSFTVCGEGECIKTLFTIYAPGKSVEEHRKGAYYAINGLTACISSPSYPQSQ